MTNNWPAWIWEHHLYPFEQRSGYTVDEVRRVVDAVLAAKPSHIMGRINGLYQPVEINGLGNTPFYDASLAAAQQLEAEYPEINNEYQRWQETHAKPIDYPDEGIGVQGNWQHMTLYMVGKTNRLVCRAFPRTAAVAKAVGSHSVMGRAAFSVLAPNTVVAPHTGPHNYRLRLHLGIDIPPDCGMRIAGETRSWQAGKCLVVNDWLEHEVWNHSTNPRVILLADIWHPELSDAEVLMLRYLMRYMAPRLFPRANAR